MCAMYKVIFSCLWSLSVLLCGVFNGLYGWCVFPFALIVLGGGEVGFVLDHLMFGEHYDLMSNQPHLSLHISPLT